jgi:signal transduction histidine kinase
MRLAGVYLLFIAVTLRGAVIFWDERQLDAVLALLVAYGLMLSVDAWGAHRKAFPQSRYYKLGYLLLQSIVVIGLLSITYSEDVFALLFIPLSIEAVVSFGSQAGRVIIALFSLALTGALVPSPEGALFGLAMGGLYSGMCFLFGGYAHQVLKAEAAHDQNQRAIAELQIAHRQLQGYADQVANLAVEQERNRLARDLHDSVTQTVFSMNLAAQSARILLDKEMPRAPAAPPGAALRTTGQLLRIEELSANALREIQSLISQLKPRTVVEEGLPTALRRLAAERQERDGLQVALEIEGEQALSEGETLGLYAIANEALTNVARHSGTQAATIRLKLGELSSLEIEDRGRGFDPQAAGEQRGHLGLAGMSERAIEIGWGFSVESLKGRGTRLLVRQNPRGGRE